MVDLEAVAVLQRQQQQRGCPFECAARGTQGHNGAGRWQAAGGGRQGNGRFSLKSAAHCASGCPRNFGAILYVNARRELAIAIDINQLMSKAFIYGLDRELAHTLRLIHVMIEMLAFVWLKA